MSLVVTFSERPKREYIINTQTHALEFFQLLLRNPDVIPIGMNGLMSAIEGIVNDNESTARDKLLVQTTITHALRFTGALRAAGLTDTIKILNELNGEFRRQRNRHGLRVRIPRV